MSIYFVHLFSELFILALLAAVCAQRRSVAATALAAALGLIFGYIAFFIFDYEKRASLGLASANALLLAALAISALSQLRPLRILALPALAAAGAGLFMRYFFKSSTYPIFEGSLLDTEGILNFAFILLALFVCAVFFFTMRFFLARAPRAIACAAALLIAALAALEAAGAYALYLIKIGAIEDESGAVLSFAAKAAYYAEFYCYAFCAISLLLAFAALARRPKYAEPAGDFDIAYRERNAAISAANSHFAAHFVLAIITLLTSLYFYLIASKPLQIDEPLIVQPSDEQYFTFPLEKVTDGHLHRYAYITASGKKIRWFIINRFPGKITPTAVFDSCMICGDLGYIEREGELVCVACNVRIFIPSVGKAGGCNPIPIENFEVDEANGLFKIPIRDITAGENYFSEVVEVSVKDPVTGAEFLNTAAAQSYLFRGINYYFATHESYEAFKKEPEKYATPGASAKYRLKG